VCDSRKARTRGFRIDGEQLLISLMPSTTLRTDNLCNEFWGETELFSELGIGPSSFRVRHSNESISLREVSGDLFLGFLGGSAVLSGLLDSNVAQSTTPRSRATTPG